MVTRSVNTSQSKANTMIFVTGGTGLVGSHLLYKLVEKGSSPIALKRSSSDINKTLNTFSYYSDDAVNMFEKIQWVEGDLLDYRLLEEQTIGIDQVYHCGAAVSFQSGDKYILKDINVEGTANIVNACLENKVSKLVHVSSIGTFGRADADGVVTEETHWNNKKTSVYSTSKYHAEMEVWRGIAEGLNAVIVNPSIIIGPGNWNTGSSKLFTTMCNGLKFYTSGTNGFVDVIDVAEIMIRLMESDISDQRFILNSENISYKELFFTMAKELGVPPPKYQANSLMSEIAWRLLAIKSLFTGKKSTITRETAETANQLYNYSNNKIREALNYNFMPIHDSIVRTAKIFTEEQNISHQ